MKLYFSAPSRDSQISRNSSKISSKFYSLDWTKNGQFTVKFMYKGFPKAGIDIFFKHLWKAKISLKIKVWLWLIWHNAIATKDTMGERGWTGSPFCQFCRQKETMLHLFFSCPAAKYVWSCVAKAIGAPARPGNFSQFFWWFPRHVPASRNVQILGVYGDPAYHCICSMQLVNITPMKHHLISITSIRVVQQKHRRSKVGA
jgi:hypothetical protein